MKRNRNFLLPLALGLLLLACAPGVAEAAITGNTYYFAGVWLEQSIQENNGPVFQSKIDGQFAITVINVTGSDDYEYVYEGFDWFFAPAPTNHTDTVDFQDNKVYFDLDTLDLDSDNMSESTNLGVYPSAHFGHPGRNYFVNPVWATHETDWDAAISDVEDDPMANLVSHSAAEGAFTFQIAVDSEQYHFEFGNLTGTITYTFTSSYDVDGVLMNWELSSRSQLSNENLTRDYTSTQRFTRTGGAGPGISLDLGSVGPIAIAG
ncbi:MAG: hypothetical protein ACW99U_21335, partial [Candidatus Thorarchaeota archaeon]